jgi:hypothetical protein
VPEGTSTMIRDPIGLAGLPLTRSHEINIKGAVCGWRALAIPAMRSSAGVSRSTYECCCRGNSECTDQDVKIKCAFLP